MQLKSAGATVQSDGRSFPALRSGPSWNSALCAAGNDFQPFFRARSRIASVRTAQSSSSNKRVALWREAIDGLRVENNWNHRLQNHSRKAFSLRDHHQIWSVSPKELEIVRNYRIPCWKCRSSLRTAQALVRLASVPTIGHDFRGEIVIQRDLRANVLGRAKS